MFLKKHDKGCKKNIVIFMLTVVMVLAMTAPVPVLANEIRVDGFSEDWADKPETYVYNWDNSDNCWIHGVWVDGICYKTPRGEYSTDVRHLVQAYKDETGIAVRIVFSRDYQAEVNSDDYNFIFGNKGTKFRLSDKSGNSITNVVKSMKPGIHRVVLRHADGSISGREVAGSAAVLKIPKDRVNCEFEFFIPYEAFKAQNGAITANDSASVVLWNANIMYDRIYIEGAPTGAFVSAMVGLGLAGAFFVKKSGMIDRVKNRKTKV